ncbi:MAG: YhdP family protein [Gammaproteobacteria bacterium]
MNRSLRYAWYVLAALLVLAAGASVALRLALPRLDAHRASIERGVERLTGMPVHLEQLGARWHGGVPSLSVEGLRLGDEGDGNGLQFARAEVDVALLESLMRREVVLERVALSGVALSVQRTPEGRFEVLGIPHHRSTFVDWLLRQRDVGIEQVELVFIDALRGSPPRRFSGLHLRLAGGRMAVLRGGIDGDDGVLGTTPVFELHLPRAADAPRELRLKVEGVAPDPLLEFAGLAADAAAPVNALDGRFWLRWQDGVLRRLAFDGTAHLDSAGGVGPTSLRVAGVASAGTDEWRLHVDTLTAGPSAGPVPTMRGLAHWRRDGDAVAVDATADLLTLDLLTALARRLPPALQQARGELQQLRFAWRGAPDAAPRWFLQTGVAHGSVGAVGLLPGFDALEAGLAANAQGGALAFDNGGVIVAAGDRFVAPVPLDGASGVVHWQRDGDAWRVATPALSGTAAAIPFEIAGSAALAAGRRPRVDAELTLGAADLSRLPRLLPKGALNERAEHWFRQAFHGGELSSARAELRGDLADFPFDAGNGLLAVEFDVADVSLEYSDKWPVVDGVRAHGAIAGRHFRVQASEARLFDSPGRDIDLSISDLFGKTPVLVGVVTVRATLPDTLKTIAQSPLKDGPARRLSTIALSGGFDLGLDLNIGLKRGAERSVLGTVSFDGNRLRTQDGKLTLEDLRGKVSFTREDFYGEELTANYEGDPVGLVVNGGIGDPNYETEFRMTGHAEAARIRTYLQRYVPYLHDWLARSGKLEAITGETAWKVVLSLPHVAAGEAPPAKKLRIESSLNGLGIDLPWPFGKVAAEPKSLAIETAIGSDAARTTRVSLGDTVRFELDQAPRDERPGSGRITRADVAFGRSEATAAQAGIWLHGQLSSLPLADWARLLEDASTPQSPTASLPIAFDVRVNELATLGQRFADVAFRGRKDANAWRITMDSARAAGEIVVPLDLATAPLSLNLTRLWLEKVESGGARTTIDPRRIPAVALECASFKYGDVDFGSASLVTTRQPDGQKLEKLVFTNDALQVDATGEWRLDAGAHHSHFSIDLKARALGDMLARFGYDSANIEGGKTRLELEADWAGMPSEFTLERLDGSLGLKVGKGRFLDIEPGGGRLFGLLSLQTLPRRLSLDFSDLFKKGFAFDRIEGWFELENGNAYTNSLLMDGPSGKVEISGRTGLAAKDYDQIAVVTPALSDSIPLASAVFGPAGIGVGAAIYLGQKVFKEVPAQVDRFLRREYAVTGPWAEPKVEKR